MAVSEDRNTRLRAADQFDDLVAGGEEIDAGALVVLDSDGYAAPGSEVTDLVARGRAAAHVDHSDGSDGDGDAPVCSGVFRWRKDNSDTTDRTRIGSDAYVVDYETVASSDGGGSRSVAGKILNADDDGVWVETG